MGIRRHHYYRHHDDVGLLEGCVYAGVGFGLVWLGKVLWDVHLKKDVLRKKIQRGFIQVADPEDVENEVGQYVMVHGVAQLVSGYSLLVAPLSNMECLGFEMEKQRLVEDVVRRKSKVKRKKRNGTSTEDQVEVPAVVKSYEVMESESRQTKWGLRMEGSNLVLPVDTNTYTLKQHFPYLELVKTTDRFEEAKGGGSKRTVGFQLKEFILPTGKQLSVLGEISRIGPREYGIGPPRNTDFPFIITNLSTSDLATMMGLQSSAYLGGAALSIGAGIFSIVYLLQSIIH